MSADRLAESAVKYDVGLAIESPVSLNVRLAVSNKLLFYLACGLAVAVSDLPIFP